MILIHAVSTWWCKGRRWGQGAQWKLPTKGCSSEELATALWVRNGEGTQKWGGKRSNTVQNHKQLGYETKWHCQRCHYGTIIARSYQPTFVLRPLSSPLSVSAALFSWGSPEQITLANRFVAMHQVERPTMPLKSINSSDRYKSAWTCLALVKQQLTAGVRLTASGRREPDILGIH